MSQQEQKALSDLATNVVTSGKYEGHCKYGTVSKNLIQRHLNQFHRKTVEPIAYDKQGRMKYHPDFHDKQKEPWTTQEQGFLIENYELLGPEQISLELGRTINTVMRRASDLRKQGLMARPIKGKRRTHKRTITVEIALKSVALPGDFHKDPADRMIVATARKFAAPLVTKDEKIRAYAHVKSIW